MQGDSVAARTARQLAAAGAAARHRYALVLSGPRPWALEAAREALAAAQLPRCMVITDAGVTGLETCPAPRALTLLGRELDAVVFDARAGLHADALGAVSGTVRAGGLLILMTPALDEWPDYPDPDYARLSVAGSDPSRISPRFLRRAVEILASDPGAVIVTPDAAAPVLPAPGPAAAAPEHDGECRTADQSAAVEAVLRVARGRARRPLVLTSDRGRGKSSALGIAAARLLRQGLADIRVTAPRLDAAEQVFARAAALLPRARSSRAAVRLDGAALTFQPPDALATGEGGAPRLLLVDEAAAIPAAMLTRLLERCPRVVFATTQHGYEGTGRGFSVRFRDVLDARTPGWKALHLEEPVRWASGDPLERLVSRLLLLDANAAEDAAVAGATPEECSVERVDRDALVADPDLLGELFGLLVLAHYRTRPFDLRLALDAPNVEIHVMRRAGHVVGTALVALEGGFDPATARAIWAGTTRPHGHLLPETLAAHAGLRRAPLLRGARIMRIAVHPAVQRRGLGGRLLDAVLAQAGRDGRDYLGSSFGATTSLLRFWLARELRPVRVSVSRGTTTGEHSAVVLRPLTPPGRELYHEARRRHLDELPRQLGDALCDLEPSLAALLMQRALASGEPLIGPDDREDLVACGFGRRLPETCIGALWRLSVAALREPGASGPLEPAGRDLLVLRVLQHRPWKAVADSLGLAGRAEAVALLRETLRRLLRQFGDADTRALAASLEKAPGSPACTPGKRD
ncbi:MAG TPA: GNAT family N-acetyltransferase [Gammaproteobacteria bacterium]|nr:GNAT family N-acetyltransferase [Gammaproteobacteria bacterium]